MLKNTVINKKRVELFYIIIVYYLFITDVTQSIKKYFL